MLKPELIAMLIVAPAAMAVVAGVCLGAASGRIGRNQLVGLRTAATMRSDAAWRQAHAAGLRPAVVATAVLVVVDLAALLARPLGLLDDALAAVLLVLLVLAVALVSVVALRVAERA